MRNNVKRSTVGLTLAALVLLILGPAQVAASTGGSSLEGLLLDIGDRPAAGHRVLLIDDGGAVIAAAEVDQDGLYSFHDISSGDYSLGIENPDGMMARVQAPPVQLESGQLARRDVRLVNAKGDEVAPSNSNSSSGMNSWWGGLPKMAKAWTVVGVLVAAGLTYSALDDDDETDASPF